MQKELLEIEFRYNDRPIGSRPATSCSKTIAIGIFDTLEEAVKAGNETLKVLSEHFQVRADDRFKVRGLFGTPDRLVTNCCYTTKGIAYFARITPLKFNDLSETIAETFTETIYAISTLPVRYDGLFDFPTTVNDMIVSIFGLAKHLEIDLFWHIEQKMRYNELREKMHGKKY